jgi:hypothetical protein
MFVTCARHAAAATAASFDSSAGRSACKDREVEHFVFLFFTTYDNTSVVNILSYG